MWGKKQKKAHTKKNFTTWKWTLSKYIFCHLDNAQLLIKLFYIFLYNIKSCLNTNNEKNLLKTPKAVNLYTIVNPV